jgi:hypothetical protein
MKLFLTLIFLSVVGCGAFFGLRYYRAGLEIQAMQEDSDRRNHQLDVMLGKAAPVYVITAQGKTWQSKEKPVPTDYGMTFVDSATGDPVRLNGPAVIELK